MLKKAVYARRDHTVILAALISLHTGTSPGRRRHVTR